MILNDAVAATGAPCRAGTPTSSSGNVSRAVLYPARLIYTWDNLAVDSNDRAVEYLHQVCPPDLDLGPIDLALACRQEKCTADDVFALAADLNRQFEAAFSYISGKSQDRGNGER